MRKRITPKLVENIKAKPHERIEVRDTICPGLTLRVTVRSKTWLLRARIDGKLRVITLGTARELGVAMARQKADEIRGVDEAATPADEARKAEPVRTLFDEYIEYLEAKGRSENHVRDVRNRLRDGEHSFMAFIKEEYDEPLFPADAVTPEMCRDWMAQTYARVPRSARHYWTALHGAFAWALGSDLDYMRPQNGRHYGLDANPAAHLPAPPPPKARKVKVDPEALRKFWTHLREETEPVTALLIEMVIAMGGVRALQLGRIRKEWVREGWVYWPEESTKIEREHALPLTPRALDIYRAARAISPRRSPLLFPSPLDINAPLTATAISKAVKTVIDRHDIEPRFVLKDWRRTVKSEGRERGLFGKADWDYWHLHAARDVSEEHYTFTEFRAVKERMAEHIDAIVSDMLGEAEAKAA